MKLLGKIGWLIIIIAGTYGFISPVMEWNNSPDSVMTYCTLHKSTISLNASQVPDATENEIFGELKQAYGMYSFESAGIENLNVSIKDDRKNNSALIIVRGIDYSNNVTYEYRFTMYVLGLSYDLKYFYKTNNYEIASFDKTEDGWRLGVKFFKSEDGTDTFIYSIFYTMLYAFCAFIIIGVSKKIKKLD
jgi:hypothetical protein